MKSSLLYSFLLLAFHALLSEAQSRCYKCSDGTDGKCASMNEDILATNSPEGYCYTKGQDKKVERDACKTNCEAEVKANNVNNPNNKIYTCKGNVCNDVANPLGANALKCNWCSPTGCLGAETEKENGIICYAALSKDKKTYYRGACMSVDCSDKRKNTDFDKFVACTGTDCNTAKKDNPADFEKISCYNCVEGKCPEGELTKASFENGSVTLDATGQACIAGLTKSKEIVQWGSCKSASCTEEINIFSKHLTCTTNFCNNKSKAELLAPTTAPATPKSSSVKTAVFGILNALMGMGVIALGRWH